jgi:trans-aconitate methyltransferase
MDAMDIPFINQFDLVFSNAALHWVPDHARMLRGVFRCLKSKGRVFFPREETMRSKKEEAS